MSQAIRWGLIGASDIAATRVIPAMRRGADTVAAVYSGSAEHGRSFAASHDIARFSADLDELLEQDIDAVYISSRNGEHAGQAHRAARAGKHVLLEKPIATTIEDAADVVDTCEALGVVLGVNHHLPGAGTHAKVRELVMAGAIGRPLGVTVRHAVLLPERLRGWRLSHEPGAGVILDITVHDASVINPLIGAPAETVTALATSQGPWPEGAEDAAMVTIGYAGSVLAQTHDAFTCAYSPTRLEVHGESGSIFADGVMTQDPVGTVRLSDAAGTREVEVTDRRDLYDIALAKFRSAVRGDGEPAVTGREGLAAYMVAQAALDSARTGRTVHVHEPARR